jgi:hypothetical protein
MAFHPKFSGGGGGGMAIGAPVVGGTAPHVLYIGAGNVLAEDTGFEYDDAANAITVLGEYRIAGNFFGTQNSSLGDLRIGLGAGADLSSGYGQNTAIGFNALNNSADSFNNVAIGWNAMENTASAGGGSNFGQANVGIGSEVMRANTSGNHNVAIGRRTMVSNTTGNFNVALGRQALEFNIGAIRNVAIGDRALRNSTLGNGNVAIGVNSLLNSNGGADNVAIGTSVANGLTTGGLNIMIGGAGAGNSISTGSENTVIGGGASGSNFNQSTCIGAWSFNSKSNEFSFGGPFAPIFDVNLGGLGPYRDGLGQFGLPDIIFRTTDMGSTGFAFSKGIGYEFHTGKTTGQGVNSFDIYTSDPVPSLTVANDTGLLVGDVITGANTGATATILTTTPSGPFSILTITTPVSNFYSMNIYSFTGTFTVTETITGATSGATAIVRDDSLGGGNIYVDTVVGTFLRGETITGGVSLVTAVMAQIIKSFELTEVVTGVPSGATADVKAGDDTQNTDSLKMRVQHNGVGIGINPGLSPTARLDVQEFGGGKAVNISSLGLGMTVSSVNTTAATFTGSNTDTVSVSSSNSNGVKSTAFSGAALWGISSTSVGVQAESDEGWAVYARATGDAVGIEAIQTGTLFGNSSKSLSIINRTIDAGGFELSGSLLRIIDSPTNVGTNSTHIFNALVDGTERIRFNPRAFVGGPAIAHFFDTANDMSTAGGILSLRTLGVQKFIFQGQGNIRTTALHNNTVTQGSAIQQDIRSGTYTPTLTAVANVDASTPYKMQWLRVGNVVTVSGQVDIDFTMNNTATELRMSLPVPSNLAATNDLAGHASNGVSNLNGRVLADAANDEALIRMLSEGTANNPFSITFTYEVI